MASKVVRARLDLASASALRVMMSEGRNESEAVRDALVEAARYRRRRSALAAEVAALASDPDDTAERRAVMSEMDAVTTDWPGVTRGEIYRVRLGKRRGHEQAGARYAVIVQADELLGPSTAIVAPTSTRAAPATFRPEVELGDDKTQILVEQLRAIDTDALGELAGKLTVEEQRAVDDALALVLELT